MARRKDEEFSSKTHEATKEEVRTKGGGTATFRGEQRAREGRGLDPLVDPMTHDGYRESLNLLLPQEDGTFKMQVGVAMPIKTDFDTTASMGRNVDVAFQVLPKLQHLINLAPDAVLRGRYYVQMCTGVIQDEGDQFAYECTEFEPDNEIDRQMTLLAPDRQGFDAPEEYQLSLYSAGYRTRTSIARYGLKGYYFILGDMMGRGALNPRLAERVFGPVDLPQSAIPVEELGRRALDSWHTFFLQVGSHSVTTRYWTSILGRERIVMLPQTEDVAEVQAVLIGLTEGVLDLQTATDFLRGTGKATAEEARRIIRTVNHIPIGAAMTQPNFGRLPKGGDIFASRDSLWPIDRKPATTPSAAPHNPEAEDNEKIEWQI